MSKVNKVAPVSTRPAGGKDRETICFRPMNIKESLPQINIKYTGVRGNANSR